MAALCHVSLVINLFTYAGGIGLCLVAYLFALERAKYLEEQAGKALVAQVIVWGLIAPVWVLYQLLPVWLGGIFFWPWCVVIWFFAVLVAMWRAARCL